MINEAATLSEHSSVQTKPKPLRWEPKTKAQASALNSRAEILLFGGAAGSLKTETLLIDAVREADNPNLNAIIFRESYPQLADIIRKSRRLLTGRPFWGKYNAGEHVWTFPRNLSEIRTAARNNDELYTRNLPLLQIPEPIYDRGATLKLGYLRNDDDCGDHDGQEYSFVGFDESTHHTEYQIRYLLSRLRSTDPTLFCRMRLATNPGNIGHSWHMQVFIGDECPHCKPSSERIKKPFTIYDDAVFIDGTRVNHLTEFIPGRVTDHLLFADPTNLAAGNEPYIRKLELQKPALAKALKEGCWAQFQGQYFTCWDETRGQDLPEDYSGPDFRMVVPFAEAPVEWWYPHFTGTDWGVGSSQAASYLCARTPADAYFPNGRIYVLKEFCRPDSDIDEYPVEFLRRFVIPDLDGERRKIVASYLGPDSWNNWGDGHTIAGQFQERVEEYGITLTKASTDREGGWQLVYGLLKSGELVICGDTCPELVKAIPTRLHDPRKPGDIRKTPGDHADDVVDAFRYAIYSFVTASDIRKPAQIRIAEATRNLDPTSAYLQYRRIISDALRDEEEEPSMYSRNASRLLRQRRHGRR
jgi:hypothetical protein